MNPTTLKTMMTIAAAISTALALVPQLAPYQAALTAFAGFLGGSALMPRPGDGAALRDAKAALVQAVQSERYTPGGTGGAAALCLALAFLVPHLTACSGPALTPVEVAARTREVAKTGEKTAELALPVFSAARATLAASFGETPNDKQKALLEQIDIGLANADAALDKVGPWVRTGEGEAAGKKALRDTLQSLALVGEFLREGGVKIPQATLDGVALALLALGPGE